MTVRVAHYVNQFFGQIGGEDMADVAPSTAEHSVGPGLLLDEMLDNDASVVRTIIGGDNDINERGEEAIGQLVSLVAECQPDLLIAGPAFNSGRYGMACAQLAARTSAELDIPVVTGMYPENPGVEFTGDAYVVVTGDRATGMRAAIPQMASLGLKLVHRMPVSPVGDNYVPRARANYSDSSVGSKRAVDMLLAKMRGEAIESEISARSTPDVPMPPLVDDPAEATIALVTDGGMVDKGNPRGLPSGRSSTYSEIDIARVDSLDVNLVDIVHHGYDTQFVAADPNRLVPLDVCRELEDEGMIGRLHNVLYATAGVSTTIRNAQLIGEGIAQKMRDADVHAAILTST